jgi:carbamoyl-phosphate synthase large subunit
MSENKHDLLFNTVLVTGCAGDIAQGLCKILRKTGAAKVIIGCDIHNDHAGSLLFDRCEIVPRASDPGYSNQISQIIEHFSIDLIIPTSEAELAYLIDSAAHKSNFKVPTLMANTDSIKMGLDKFATSQLLQNIGISFPWTTKVSEGAPSELPCILKMRHGQGSKFVSIVSDPALISSYTQTRPNDIWQELLLPSDEEYTCGLYRSPETSTRCIIMKRKLIGGLTGSGEVVENIEIAQYLSRIAEGLNLSGSINVQLRMTERGPVAFEINARFSSTVVFRHLMGFEDLIWSLQALKGVPISPFSHPTPGTKFYRGALEYIL